MADDLNTVKCELNLLRRYAAHAFLTELCMVTLPLDYICFMRCVIPMLVAFLVLTLFYENPPQGNPSLRFNYIRLGASGASGIVGWIVCRIIFLMLDVPYSDSKAHFCLNHAVSSYGFIFGTALALLASYFVTITAVSGIRCAYLGFVIAFRWIRILLQIFFC